MWLTVRYVPEGFSTRSDETGAFTLEHVPPGDCRVSIDGAISPAIEVNPGETAHVQIGGTGRPVTGKLVAPRDTPIRNWTNQVTLAIFGAETDSYRMPENLTGNAARRWKLEFEDTSAGRDWFRAQYTYVFKVAPGRLVRHPGSFAGKIPGDSNCRSRQSRVRTRLVASLCRRASNRQHFPYRKCAGGRE